MQPEHATPRYSLYAGTSIAARILDVEPAAFLRRAGLKPDPVVHETYGVTAEEFFRAWNALMTEYGRADGPLVLGQALARGPFIPAMLALAWAPKFSVGIERLGKYKRLIGPCFWGLERTAAETMVVIGHYAGDLPPSLGIMQCVLLVESLRQCTQHRVIPKRVYSEDLNQVDAETNQYLGMSVGTGAPAVVFDSADTERDFVSSQPQLWQRFASDLDIQLDQLAEDLHTKVRVVIRRRLAEGGAALEQVSSELGLGGRTLQRSLEESGLSFAELLDSTRLELARHYLTRSALNNEEIATLLGFQSANSFYRAFKGWTGMTPSVARTQWTRAAE